MLSAVFWLPALHKSQQADIRFSSTPLSLSPSSVTQVSITTGAQQLIIAQRKAPVYNTHVYTLIYVYNIRTVDVKRERESHSRNTANFHLLSSVGQKI